MERGRFLYVCHNFPPLVGGGVARSVQNCKLLPEFNWRPTVLTVAADNSYDVDREYAEMGIEILRAGGIVKENRVRGLPGGIGKYRVPLTTKLLRAMAIWLLVPDRQVLWKFSGQRLAVQAAKRHDWQCVFGTLPPVSTAWIAKCIAKRLQLPFVLEYRDMINDKCGVEVPTALHQAALRSIERGLVRAAARVIVVSPAMKDWFVRRHNIDPKKVEVIATGFLPEDKEFFHGLPNPENERFTMIYAGLFYRERKPDTALGAIRTLIDRKVIPADKLRAIFIGNLAPRSITELELEDVVEIIPQTPRDEVFKWYACSDLLLLICAKDDYQNVTYPGKLFEYLMTEKPILGLMDKNSDTARILEQSGIGLVADSEDVEETAAKIEHVYKLWVSKMLTMKPNHKVIEQFNYCGIVNRLVSIFEQVSIRNY